MAALAVAPTLFDHFAELSLISRTLEVLEDEGLAPDVRTELEAELVASLAGTRDKIDRTANVLAAMEAAASAAAAEIERLTARKKRIEAQHERLTDYVIGVLQASNVAKFDGHTSTLSIRNNPVKVVIDTDEYLDMDYLRFPPIPEPVPDKIAIAAALKRGENVAGCRLAQTCRLVRS